MPLLGWAPPDSSSPLIRERNTIIPTIRETSCFLGPLVLGPWARQSAPRFSSRVSGGEILSHVGKAGRREQSLQMGPPSPSDPGETGGVHGPGGQPGGLEQTAEPPEATVVQRKRGPQTSYIW